MKLAKILILIALFLPLFEPKDKNINLEPVHEIEHIQPTSSPKPKPAYTEGRASYYNETACEANGTVYQETCFTANGTLFDKTDFTAACRPSLLNKKIRVYYKNKSVDVVCNDTGSFQKKYGRVIDLSEKAFEALAPLSSGVIQIKYDKI